MMSYIYISSKLNINHMQVRKVNVNRVLAFSELPAQHLSALSNYQLPSVLGRKMPLPATQISML